MRRRKLNRTQRRTNFALRSLMLVMFILFIQHEINGQGAVYPLTLEVCQNTGDYTLTWSGSGTPQYWERYNGGVWTNLGPGVPPAPSSITVSSTMAAGIYKYRVYVDLGGGNMKYSVEATYTIYAASASGAGVTFTYDASTRCQGSNTGTITMGAGATGSIVNWVYSTTNSAPWHNLGETSSVLTFNNLSTTTYFKTIVKNGECPSTLSANTATINVLSSPVAGTIAADNSSVCTGSNTTLRISGQTGIGIDWQLLNGVWTSVDNANHTTYTTPAHVPGTFTYQAVVNQGACKNSAGATVTPTATTSPVNVTFYAATIPVSPSGATVVAYNDATPRNITVAPVNGSVARWEYSTDGNLWIQVVNSTNTLTYSNLLDNTYYRAIVKNGVCSEQASPAPALITVANGGTVTSSGNDFCRGVATGTVNVSGVQGSSFTWEKSISPFTVWNSVAGSTNSATIAFTDLQETTKYRVNVNNGKAYSAVTTIAVNAPTVAGTVTADEPVVCPANTDNHFVTLAGNTGSVVRWESSTSDGAPWSVINSTSTSLTYNNLTQTTYYRAIVKSGVCSEAATPSTQVLVASGGTVSSDNSVCSNDPNANTLTLTGSAGAVAWWEKSEYNTGTSTWGAWTPFGNAGLTTYSYSNLTKSTRYKASITNTCDGGRKVESAYATIQVYSPTVGGSVSGNKTVRPGTNSGTVVLSGNLGSVVRWEYSVTGSGGPWTTVNNTTSTLSYSNLATTTYYRSVVKNGPCNEAVPTNIITITVAQAGSINASTTVCASDITNRTLTLVNSLGSIARWQKSIDNGANWTDLAGTSGLDTYTYSALTQTTLYRAVISEDGGEIYSTPAQISVKPLPVVNFTTNTACIGYATNFTNNTTLVGDNILNVSWDFGDGSYSTGMNPSRTFATNGTYSVRLTVNTASGCTQYLNKDVIVKPKPSVNFSFANKCKGKNVEYTNLSELNANTLTYRWSFGDGATSTSTNPTHAYTPDGNYSVKLATTASNGCSDSVTQTVTVYPLPLPVFTVANICAGSSASFINNSTVPTGNLTYAWNFGGPGTSALTSPSQQYNAPGDYSVKLIATSIYGCQDSLSRTLTVYPNPVAAFTYNNPCFGQNTNFANATTLSSGTLTYNWAYGNNAQSTATNPVYQYPNIGTYVVTLTATSDRGCTNSTSNVVSISPVPRPNFDVKNICTLDTVWLTNYTIVAGGTLTYKWYYGDGSTATTTDTKHVYAAKGNYNIKLIATNNSNCRDSITKTIEVYPLPATNFGVSPACQLKYANFTDSSTVSSGAIVKYHWDFGNGNTSTLKNPKFAFAEAATYNATLTTTTNYGCSTSKTKAVFVPSKPLALFSNTNVCTNIAMPFSNLSTVGTPTKKCSWTFGDGLGSSQSESPAYTYPNPGYYNVKLVVEDANGCKDSITREVMAYARAVPGFTFGTACEAVALDYTNTTVFTAGTMRYKWTFETNQTSDNAAPMYTFKVPGTYPVTLEITTDRGCIDAITKTVVVHKKPKVLFTSDNVCLGYKTTFANLTTDIDGRINWNWNFGDRTSDTATSTNHTYLAPGTYLVKLTATSEYGCANDYDKNTEVYAKPYANYNNDAICATQQAKFDNISNITSGTLTYKWTFGNGMGSTETSPKVLYDSTGTYNVRLIATSNYNCIDSVTKQLTVHPLPVTDFDAAVVCKGFPTYYMNKSTVVSGSIVYYQWDFGDLSNSLQENPVHQYISSGTYKVNLLSRTDKGCETQKQRSIIVAPSPIAAFDADPVCFGDPMQFINKTYTTPDATGVLQSEWNFGKDLSNITNPKYIFSNPGTHKVKLKMVYTNTQCADSITKPVFVYGIPEIYAGRDTIIPKGFPYVLQATASPGSYNWSPSEGIDQPLMLNPTLRPINTQNYVIQVVSSEGCVNSDTVEITAEESYDLYKLKISATNLLTPNGNGKNETWVIPNIEFYPGNHLVIFDRWGNEVFSATDYQNDWRGHNKVGDPLPDGTYYFVIYFNDSKKVHKGAITLLRNK